MTDQPTKKAASFPPIGSFPGYKRALGLVNAWIRAAGEQGDVWSGAWGKMRRGRYETEDWFQSMARSLDITVDAVKATWGDRAPTQQPKPAWLAFTLGQLPTSLPVALAQPLDPVADPEVTPPSLVGAASLGGPLIEAKATTPEKLLVTVLEPKNAIQAGEYVAFVKAAGQSVPLAIVSVTVPETWSPATSSS